VGAGRPEEVRLTDEQQRLVRENIGLVAVHLRRHVSNIATPQRDREWEDLFQEGCLGLVRAAVGYRPERGIPFPAFALPRIHSAVSRALQSRFSTVRIPPKRGIAAGASPDSAQGDDRSERPKVRSLSGDLQSRLADTRRHDPDDAGHETVGQRLRAKYERAVRSAGDVISGQTSRRGDRDELVRVLVEERFMVPLEESRRALRQIARETHSSYARVAQCDKQLGAEIRSTLEVDPEFRELHRRVRSDPDGTRAPIDDEFERGLAELSAEEFVRRFRAAHTPKRADMLASLLRLSDSDMSDVVRDRVLRMPMRKRELLLAEPVTEHQKSR
jgi:hypothetical protein